MGVAGRRSVIFVHGVLPYFPVICCLHFLVDGVSVVDCGVTIINGVKLLLPFHSWVNPGRCNTSTSWPPSTRSSPDKGYLTGPAGPRPSWERWSSPQWSDRNPHQTDVEQKLGYSVEESMGKRRFQ